MTNALLIVVAISAGGINALQLAMLGNIKLSRGTFEATTISMLASLAGMSLLMAVLPGSAIGSISRLPLRLPSPTPWE
jgi:hypothetical protein